MHKNFSKNPFKISNILLSKNLKSIGGGGLEDGRIIAAINSSHRENVEFRVPGVPEQKSELSQYFFDETSDSLSYF